MESDLEISQNAQLLFKTLDELNEAIEKDCSKEVLTGLHRLLFIRSVTIVQAIDRLTEQTKD